MVEQKFFLQFEGLSRAEANKYATELQSLLENVSEVNVNRRQEDEDSQDFGATLIIGVLSAPAVSVLINRIFDYLEKRRSAKVTIKTETGELVAENLGSNDASKLTDKWLGKMKS